MAICPLSLPASGSPRQPEMISLGMPQATGKYIAFVNLKYFIDVSSIYMPSRTGKKVSRLDCLIQKITLLIHIEIIRDIRLAPAIKILS